jgi:flagellar biogenesis protein FliO
MPDLSKPIELSFIFGSVVVIMLLIGVGIFLVKRYQS